MQEDMTDWVKSKFSTLSGEIDTRPGHYYVVSHRQGRQPEEGYHRLAGPWPTHKEADDQVAAVRAYAERHGGQEAFFQHYITARMPIVDGVEALPSKLGSDVTRWTPSTNRQRFADEYTKALAECVAAQPDFYGFGSDRVAEVAQRMLNAVDRDSANYDGPAFKLTCKRLKIKHTRKAIRAFVTS